MKKHFYFPSLFFAAGLVSLATQAQIKKGTILLGGNLMFYTQKTTPDNPLQDYHTTQTNLSLNPSVGIAVKDNLLKGFELSYSNKRDEQAYPQGNYFTSSKIYVNNYGAGFFLRRYKYLGGRFYIFMQGRLGGAYSTSKNEYKEQSKPATSTDIKGYNISLGFYPGVSYAITDWLQLETGFQNLVYAQYSHQKQTDQVLTDGTVSTYKTNAFSLGTNLSNRLYGFVVGFRILLNRCGS